MTASTSQSRMFLRALWSAEPPGRLAVSWKSGNGLRTRTFTGRAEAATCAVSHKADTWIRTTTLPRDWNGNGRGAADDATALPGLFADLDVKVSGVKTRGFESVEDAREFLHSLPLKPSLIVESGGGLQPWWILREPLILDTPESRAEAASLLKCWERFLQLQSQADVDIDSVAELARILRLPGTLNYKYDPPRPVTLADVTEERHDPSDFEPFLTAGTDEDRGISSDDRTERKPTGATEMPEDLLDALSGSGKAGELWRFGKDGGKDKSVNDAALAATLGVLGFDDAAIEAALRLYKLGQIGSGKLTGKDAERQLGRLLGIAAKARANREESGEESNGAETQEQEREPTSEEQTAGTGATATHPEPLSMPWAEFREREWPEPEWIVPGFIAKGQHTLLHGWRGVGKTWLMASIVVQAVTGVQVLPVSVSPQRWRVLYLDGEMPPRLLQERIEALMLGAGIDPRDVQGLEMLSKMALPPNATMHSLATPKGRDELCRTLDRIGGVDAVFIDSVSTCAKHPEHDENTEAGWIPVQDLLLDLGKQSLGTLTVHHQGKDPGRGQRGTSARETVMLLSIALTKPKERFSPLARFGLEYQKTRAPVDLPSGFELALDAPLEGDGLVWTIAQQKTKTKSEQVAEAIQADPSASNRTIADRVSCSHTLVGRIRQELDRHGVKWGYQNA